MKKIVSLALALVLVLSLTACGGKDGGKSADPNLGKYIGTEFSSDGDSWYSLADLYDGECYIELKSDGKGVFCLGGEATDIKWSLESDGALTLKRDGLESNGLLQDGCIMLDDLWGNEVYTLYEKEDADSSPEKTGDTLLDWWNGDWYGWWAIYDAGGEYTDFVDSWSDVCATISVDGDSGLVDIWDDTCEEGTNLGYIDVAFKPGKTNNGRMLSESGYFLIDDVNSGDWVVDPGDSVVSRFDQMICIHGTVVEHDNSENWVEYIVFLRPWGMSWEDVRSDACEDMPYSDMMPYYYDEWYVPQMNGPMPDYFDFDLGEAA